MKQTYEQRVRALAETMYRDEAGIKKDSGINKVDWALFGERYMKYARIAVAEMAKEVAAHIKWDGRSEAEMRSYLKEDGLIPDDGQPDIEPVRPGDRMYGHKPHNPDNPEPETEAIVERFEAIDEEGPEVRVTLPCGYRARFWLMGLSDEEYIRRTQCMKKIDHGRDNMKIKGGQEAGSDDL